MSLPHLVQQLSHKEYTMPQNKINNQILDLQFQLAATDYIVLKIAEAATEEEKQALREKYAEQLNNRKWWRAQINSL